MTGIQNEPIDPSLTEHETEVREVLRGHVQKLAGDIGIRHDSQPESLDAAVNYLLEVWRELDQVVKIESYPTEAWDAKNLVVEWPGKTQPKKIVVVGAHFDTVRSTPGADDNASAVAMMLLVCETLRNQIFDYTLRFAAFANEEPPHFIGPTMGSRVYAEACKSRGDDIHAMVCLEMVGYYDTAEGSQELPKEFASIQAPGGKTRGDFIAFVGSTPPLERLAEFTQAFNATVDFPAIPVPDKNQELWVSDHGPFWDQGYPALMVTDTSWFRNPNYHQMTDLPDTLDYDRMARVAVGVTEGVANLARRVAGVGVERTGT